MSPIFAPSIFALVNLITNDDAAYFVEVEGASPYGPSKHQSSIAAVRDCNAAFVLRPEDQERGGRAVCFGRCDKTRGPALVLVALELRAEPELTKFSVPHHRGGHVVYVGCDK